MEARFSPKPKPKIEPDFQLVLINAEIKSKQNANLLLNRKINWGQFNKKGLENVSRITKDLEPILYRINNNTYL